jgi:hypothetical protein
VVRRHPGEEVARRLRPAQAGPLGEDGVDALGVGRGRGHGHLLWRGVRRSIRPALSKEGRFPERSSRTAAATVKVSDAASSAC